MSGPAATSGPAAPAPGHVLVVGMDGVRYDTLLATPTPALDSVAARGSLSPVRVNDAGPTISGPGWATILTGVLAPTHRIFGNDLSPNALAEHPDVDELAACSADQPRDHAFRRRVGHVLAGRRGCPERPRGI